MKNRLFSVLSYIDISTSAIRKIKRICFAVLAVFDIKMVQKDKLRVQRATTQAKL